MTTKKTTKKTKKPAESAAPEERMLSSDELLEMEIGHAKQDGILTNIKLCKERVLRAEKELQLLSANYTLKKREHEDLKLELIEAEKRLEQHKEQCKDRNERIKANHDLPDNQWGYDPMTGKIICKES